MRTLQINADALSTTQVLRALASKPRLRILELLSDHIYNIREIADALDMPQSTANLHVTALEEAGLVKTEWLPAQRGRQKMCARAYDSIIVKLPHGKTRAEHLLEYSMPVGAFVNSKVTPTCGLISAAQIIGLLDDPASFYEPERINAQLLWFHFGYVEYRFPNRLLPNKTIESLQLSMEVCSEAPLHHEDWPSDITIWINGVEIGDWTSPRDFGGRRGALTPEWWESWNSQYGLLKIWQVNDEGSFVDDQRISDVRLPDLHFFANDTISVKIGVKPDAERVGGINIFGSRFGNYPQDIVLRLRQC
jgi:predicted transcriptional regulator